MKRTSVQSVIGKDICDTRKSIDIGGMSLCDMAQLFHDGTLDFGQKRDLLSEMSRRDPDMARNTVSDLCRNIEHTGSKDLLSFACFLIDEGGCLDFFMKLECATSLNVSEFVDGPRCYAVLLKEYRGFPLSERPSVAIYVDVLGRLLCLHFNEGSSLLSSVYESVDWLVKDSGLSPDFLYKCVLGFQRDADRPVVPQYLTYLFLAFFSSTSSVKHKVLSGQYLLSVDHKDRGVVEKELRSIASDVSVDYNHRADCADLLLKLGDSSSKALAKGVIAELGRQGTKEIRTVFSDRQNVHDKNIEESVRQFLLKIAPMKHPTAVSEGDRPETFEDASRKFLSLIDENARSSVQSSMLRIKIDQIIYEGSQTLETIFIKVVSIVCGHADRDLLVQRLTEELVDMDNTCSSGHVSRLANVFSGIGEFNMNIGYKKQIQGNISGRINKLILSIEDEKEREEVLLQMTNHELEDRLSWNKFYLKNIGNLRSELYKEYVDGGYISADEFDLYFREGVQFFETGIM